MQNRRKNSRRRRASKRRCTCSILGEDELLLIMQYYVEHMIEFTKHRSVRSFQNENVIRDSVFRTLFGLSCSKCAFQHSKTLFAKYLWHTQSYIGVYSNSFHIAQMPYISSWVFFKWRKRYRLCMECAWRQTITIICLVVHDAPDNYQLHFLSDKESKEGSVTFCKAKQCVPIISMSKRKTDLDFLNGLSVFNFYKNPLRYNL